MKKHNEVEYLKNKSKALNLKDSITRYKHRSYRIKLKEAEEDIEEYLKSIIGDSNERTPEQTKS